MKKRNYNQLVRIDAMKKFMEVSDTSFGIGRFKFFFAELDQNNKQKANGDYYLDLLDLVNLRNFIEQDELSEISKQKAVSGDLYSPLWQVEGGKRLEDKIIAKRLKILPSKKANHVMIQYEIGEGAEGRTGGFVFKGKAQKFIGIPVEIDMLRKNLAYVEMAYRGYESSYMEQKHNVEPKKGEILKTLKDKDDITKSLSISDSAFNIDRVKSIFLEKNNDGSDKERIEYFIDILDYLNLNSILSNPNTSAFIKKKAETNKDFIIFEVFGGKSASRKPRLDGKAAAWRLRLYPHDKDTVKLVAQVGTGSEGRNGGVMYEETEREVSLVFNLSSLRAFVQNGLMSLQSYYNAYAKEKYAEETKKRIENEKEKFWKKKED